MAQHSSKPYSAAKQVRDYKRRMKQAFGPAECARFTISTSATGLGVHIRWHDDEPESEPLQQIPAPFHDSPTALEGGHAESSRIRSPASGVVSTRKSPARRTKRAKKASKRPRSSGGSVDALPSKPSKKVASEPVAGVAARTRATRTPGTHLSPLGPTRIMTRLQVCLWNDYHSWMAVIDVIFYYRQTRNLI